MIEFRVSGARIQTGTLLNSYKGTHHRSEDVFTLKIEVVRTNADFVKKENLAAYLVGQPCADTWYPV